MIYTSHIHTDWFNGWLLVQHYFYNGLYRETIVLVSQFLGKLWKSSNFINTVLFKHFLLPESSSKNPIFHEFSNSILISKIKNRRKIIYYNIAH